MRKRKNDLLAKIAMGVMAAALVLGSSAMAFAEEDGSCFEEENLYVYDCENVVEYTEATSEAAYTIMDLDPLTRATQLRWTVLPNNRLESVSMYIEAGQYLHITGQADPDDISFKYGYTDHSTDWFCWGQGGFAHTFQIQTSGYYHIYFRNTALLKSLSVNFIYGVTN